MKTVNKQNYLHDDSVKWFLISVDFCSRRYTEHSTNREKSATLFVFTSELFNLFAIFLNASNAFIGFLFAVILVVGIFASVDSLLIGFRMKQQRTKDAKLGNFSNFILIENINS